MIKCRCGKKPILKKIPDHEGIELLFYKCPDNRCDYICSMNKYNKKNTNIQKNIPIETEYFNYTNTKDIDIFPMYSEIIALEYERYLFIKKQKYIKSDTLVKLNSYYDYLLIKTEGVLKVKLIIKRVNWQVNNDYQILKQIPQDIKNRMLDIYNKINNPEERKDDGKFYINVKEYQSDIDLYVFHISNNNFITIKKNELDNILKETVDLLGVTYYIIDQAQVN